MFSRRTVVFILAILALLAGLITGRSILFTLAYLLGLLLIAAFLWAYANINWTHISRVTRSRRTQVGRPLEERFRVTNTGRLPKLWLQVTDFSTVPGHNASQVISGLGPKKGYSWRTTTVCTRRGRYQLGPMQLTTSDPFGLFEMNRYLEATTNVVVYPMTVDVHYFTLPAGVLPGGDALRRRTHYITTNAASVREYAPGDSFSRIHWRSTARRGRLIVKEFELDPLADIWIVPDMSMFEHVSREEKQEVDEYEVVEFDGRLLRRRRREPQTFQLPPSTEEYTVTIAASLAQYFLRLERAVGMVGYGQSQEVVQPDRGERQQNRILETLAVLRAEGNIPLRNLFQAEQTLLPRGVTLIVITPTTDPVWANVARELQRRGSRVVTISVNPESFGSPDSSMPLVELLRTNRVTTYVVNEGENLTATLSQRM
jgi:uncharacterized protein (DUF58 family)